MFTVSVDHKTGFHFVQVDKKYMAYSRGIDDVVDFHRATDVMTFVSAADPAKVVILRDIRNRAILTIPYTEYDLKQSKFYVVVHGIGGPTSDMTKGRILFRQDQPHIDLFVFFSVFFSCFFLFLAVCIVLWKFKHVYGVRQTRQRVAIELQTMASRPFGSVYLVFQRRSPQARPVSVLTVGLAALPAEPSTSADLRKSLAKNGKRKKRNVVDPHEALSPSSSLALDAPPNKNPKLMPMAMEFLHGGAAAVATFAMELPGDQDCPVRFCLASTLVTAPQIYAHFNAKN
jgi:multipile epidermal growth factor-like domains protein 8